MNKISQDSLKDLLDYDPEAGKFTWKVIRGRVTVGSPAGCERKSDGYVRLMIDGKMFLAHRLAWLYVHGVLPAVVDHIDGNPRNNAISNLRACTTGQNAQNQRSRRNTVSGLLGACYDKSTGRFMAQIKVNRKHINLGKFDTAEAAHQAYLAAKVQFHTFNPVVNR